MTECVVVAGAEPQEQSGRQSRRTPGVRLRLVAIGQNRIEHMTPETGLGGMAALPVTVTEQRMKPPVGFSPGGEIIDQLDMAITLAQHIDALHFVEIQCERVAARQSSESAA